MLRVLSEEQVAFFHSNGYLVLPDYWSKDTVQALRDRIHAIIKGYGNLESDTKASVFTTKEQSRDDDEYFLNSGANISFFWEVLTPLYSMQLITNSSLSYFNLSIVLGEVQGRGGEVHAGARAVHQ